MWAGRRQRFISRMQEKNNTASSIGIIWFKCGCVEEHLYVCKWIRSPSAEGDITLKILLIISSPSGVSRFPFTSQLYPLTQLPEPPLMPSVFVLLCYISAIALGSLGETVKGIFHREKRTLNGQTERRDLLAEGLCIMQYFIFTYFMKFEDAVVCLREWGVYLWAHTVIVSVDTCSRLLGLQQRSRRSFISRSLSRIIKLRPWKLALMTEAKKKKRNLYCGCRRKILARQT